MRGEILPPASAGSERDAAIARLRQIKGGVSAGLMEMAAILAQWRGRLSHGEWLPFLAESTIERTFAAKLVKIHSDDRLQMFELEHLPVSAEALYELTFLNDDDFRRALTGNAPPTLEEIRGIRHTSHPPVAEPGSLPAGKYGAILADPPWKFETWSKAGRGRTPDRHYPPMTFDEIAAMGPEVEQRAADDCALFLWVVTGPRRDYEAIIDAWGFEPKGEAFVWVKQGAFGGGYGTRKRHETCLFGTRGSPRRLDAGVDSVIEAPRGAHSEKPAETHARIERLYAGPYVELFARDVRDGWDVWGNHPGLGEGGQAE